MRNFVGEQLVIATHNAGKFQEFRNLLAPLEISFVLADALGLNEPEETEDSFAGNARIKAHYAASASGRVALSDDSGLSVAALDGAPGIHTAGWATTPTGRDFRRAMHKTWSLLEEKRAPEPRLASFMCTLCLAWPDGHDEIFEGRVDGRLIWPPRGHLGFGFDPMFVPTKKHVTFGEMRPEKKEAISHRTQAFTKLVACCFA